MEPINYFQHDYRSRLDKKLLKIRKQHGMSGVGVYWCLVEMLHEGSGFIEMDVETIAYELQCDEKIVIDVIELCFEYFEGNVTCKRVIENLQFRRDKASAKSKQGTEAVNKRWEKYRNSIPSVYEPNTQPIPNHTIEKEIEIDIDKDIDKGIEVVNSIKVYSFKFCNDVYNTIIDYLTDDKDWLEAVECADSTITWDKFYSVLNLSETKKTELRDIIVERQTHLQNKYLINN